MSAFRLLAIVALTLVGLDRAAQAQTTVDIELHDDAADAAAALGIDLDELAGRLADGIDDGLHLVDVASFLRSFGNASSFASRGLGADYASNGELFTIGVAAGVGVSLDDGEADQVGVGAAAAVTFLVGMNLARWNHRELTLYGNFYHTSGDGEDDLLGSLTSVGAHAQYKFYRPTTGWKRMLAQWGGIDVTAGIEVSHWSVGLGDSSDVDFDVSGEGDSADRRLTMTATVDGAFDLSSTVVVLPVEVTTNVRLLYVLSAYVGGGLDLQVGRSSLDLDVAGNVTTELDGETNDVAAMTVSSEQHAAPSVLQGHLLAGLQANVWKLRVFGQGTMMPGSTYGAALGVRLVW